jgi:hypothetical protein
MAGRCLIAELPAYRGAGRLRLSFTGYLFLPGPED